MQLLEAKIESGSEAGQSLGWVHVKVDGKHTRILYRLFNTADNSYKSWKECGVLLRAQAKVRLLQAIGSCRTLRRIRVDDLTGKELEALLTPMQSNPVLDAIYINASKSTVAETTSAANDYAERTCEILGKILQTSRTLKDLTVYVIWRLTTAGVWHLASGVRGNVESPPEVLCIGKWEESSVANQVAEIVLSAPRLRKLYVYGGGGIDDDGTDALANALVQTTSLRELDDVGRGASDLLLKALIGNGSDKSIATLELTGPMDGIGDSLPLILSANQSLKEVSCYLEESLSPNQMAGCEPIVEL